MTVLKTYNSFARTRIEHEGPETYFDLYIIKK